MPNSVVVTYQIKAERRDEHVALIDAVFEQLVTEQRSDVSYHVVCLEDGVSFVHVSTAFTDDGSSPLPGLSAFREFNASIADRVATPPTVKPGDLIGSYEPPA